MKQEVILNVKKRETRTKGTVKKLRRGGKIPAVLYGKGEKNASLVLDAKEFLREIVHAERGENVIVSLRVEGADSKPKNAIIKEIQIDPVKRNVIHVDFCEVSMTREIEISVPLVVIGNAVGVESGGVLDHIVREVKVKCLPANMPSKIEVDVTELKTGGTLKIKDLKLPPKVEILEQPENIIISIIAPTVLEEAPAAEAAPVEGEAAEPEVIGRKKKEEEGEEEGEAEEGKEEEKAEDKKEEEKGKKK